MPAPYFDPATAEPVEQHYRHVAGELVQSWAPAPDPEPADYPTKAARAERLVYDYLRATGGAVIDSRSLSGVGSKAFNTKGLDTVRRIVADAMGDYYTGGGFNKAYVSHQPIGG